jgi:hypothetical protein
MDLHHRPRAYFPALAFFVIAVALAVSGRLPEAAAAALIGAVFAWIGRRQALSACPGCGERVDRAATVCHHCGYDFRAAGE